MKNIIICFVTLLSALLYPGVSSAHEKKFGYSYEAYTEAEGVVELEQKITTQTGRKDQSYHNWDLRSELEYGVTSNLQGALLLDLQKTYQGSVGDEEGLHYSGIGTEWILQLLSPQRHPVGLALYAEGMTDKTDHELEGKVLLSKELGRWALVFNSIYEAEWEHDDEGGREKEAELSFTAGASYNLGSGWALGLESRNKSAFPGGFDLRDREYNSWNVGPVLHWADEAGSLSGTLTIFPQVYGNGDGSSGNLQLDHSDRMEVRLIISGEL